MICLLAASSLQAAGPTKLLPTLGGAPVVDTGSGLLFNRETTEVTEHDYKLLIKRGYRFGDKGRLYAPGSGQPVSLNDYFYVVEEIRSRQRLKALLEISLIQSRNSYSKNLPQKDRDEIRSIARENWHLLSHRIRTDLESLFSNKEIFELKRRPEFAHLAVPSRPLEIGNLPDGAVVTTDHAINTLAGPIIPLALKSESSKKPAARFKKRKKKPTPPPAWTARTRGIVKPLPPPWKPDPALPVKPLPAPWKKFKRARERLKPVAPVPAVKALPAPWKNEAEAPAPKPITSPKPKRPEPAPIAQDPLPNDGFTPAERAMRSTVSGRKLEPDLGDGYRSEVPAPPPTAIAKGMTPVLVPAAALPPPEPPKPPPAYLPKPQPKEIPVEYPEIDEVSFSKFLESAPYKKEIKPLLALIGKHVREPERRVAIGILTTSMPHIIIDSLKAGLDGRASIGRIQRGASFARIQIALHDGPVLSTTRSLFSGKDVFFMPDDASYYAERGKSMPAQESYLRDSISVRDLKGEFGMTRFYKDGSTRLRRTEHAIAGALLNALMRIDGDFRGWVDDHHSRMRAEAVEFRFYRSIKADTDAEPHLDPELTARYGEWFHRPEDYLDLQLNAFFDRTREEELALLESAEIEGVGKSGPPTEFRLPPSDSPAKRAWLASDKRARGKE